jgi:hypothetical protein
MKNDTTASITTNCLIDKKTFINFSKFHRFYATKSTRNLVFFPLMLLGLAILNWIIGNNILGCFLLGISLFIPIWSLTLFYLSILKQVETFKLDNPRVFYTLTFSNQGIHISNKNEQADYQWTQVHKIYRTKSSIYLYFTPVNAFILPLGNIKEHTMDDLWSFFQKHINKDKLICKNAIK